MKSHIYFSSKLFLFNFVSILSLLVSTTARFHAYHCTITLKKKSIWCNVSPITICRIQLRFVFYVRKNIYNTFDTLEKQNTSPQFARWFYVLIFKIYFLTSAFKCLQMPNYSTRRLMLLKLINILLFSINFSTTLIWIRLLSSAFRSLAVWYYNIYSFNVDYYGC